MEIFMVGVWKKNHAKKKKKTSCGHERSLYLSVDLLPPLVLISLQFAISEVAETKKDKTIKCPVHLGTDKPVRHFYTCTLFLFIV